MAVLVYQTRRKTLSHVLAKCHGWEKNVRLCFPQQMDMSFQVGHVSMSPFFYFLAKSAENKLEPGLSVLAYKVEVNFKNEQAQLF